ncbi:MAG: hypothetical protein LCH41_06515 [Armatimonadetes bacterium]|nr:hypothetical protein [Armatimonadota bacterium]
MKKELPPAVTWAAIGLGVLALIVFGFMFWSGPGGNNEPSQELQRKQAEAQAGMTQSNTGAAQQQPAVPGMPPPSGEQAAREAMPQGN